MMAFIIRYRPYVIFSFFIAMIVFLAMIFGRNEHALNVPQPQPLNEGWVLVLEDSPNTSLETLPINIDVEAGTQYTIQRVLDEAFDRGQTLLLRSSLQNITVTLDGVIIYDKNFDDETVYASLWHLVDIPFNSSDSLLEITFSSPYEAMSGIINPIEYGSDGMIYWRLITSYGFRLMIAALAMVSGIVMMFASLFFLRKDHLQYVYLGLFAVLLSFWLLGESRLIQFFTGNTFFIGSISYLSLSVFPIPILYYLRKYTVNKYRWPFEIYIVAFYINILLILSGQLLGWSDFFETVIITQFLLGTVLTFTVIILLYERIKLNNTKTKRPLILIAILLVTTLLEFVLFAGSDFRNTGIFASIGIGIVTVLIVMNYVSFVIERYKLIHEKEYYERLAYIDPLTGAKNRLAYEQDFERIFSNAALINHVRLIYFDLDDLKSVNDHYGHLEGDQMIKTGFEIIQSIFKNVGTIYRIGGDEFACISTVIDDDTYEQLLQKFSVESQRINKKTPYHFRISMGMTVYQPNQDEKPSDMMKRADDLMYANKSKKSMTK